ncbi:NEW3 domain-containing protein [Chitinophaga sp.]|uniref:COG1470 family protein n=1 Tax=Chitinophaga sp. TaxID=1869181 RepID=UPI0031DF4D20
MSATTTKHQRRMTRSPYLFVLLFVFLFSNQIWAQTSPPFTARLINIEAAANTTFNFNTKLKNVAPVSRIFQLSAVLPAGWNANFKIDGMSVTSVNIDSGRTADIGIEIVPTLDSKPGKYAIPVTALVGNDSLKLSLEAVIKGTYGVTLTTPTGKLSEDVTEGSTKELQLVVKNTGTIPLDNLEFSAQNPSQWQLTFAPTKILHLEAGADTTITATLQVPDKTLAGDYMTNVTVRNSNANAKADFRITVKTSALTGWLGLFIILIAVGAVYFLIRKYGRR